MGTRDRRHRMPPSLAAGIEIQATLSRSRWAMATASSREWPSTPRMRARMWLRTVAMLRWRSLRSARSSGPAQAAADLALARREFRVRATEAPPPLLDLAEDADHLAAAFERNSAQLGCEAFALCVQKDATVVRALRWSQEISAKFMASVVLLRARGAVSSPPCHVPHEPLGRRVHRTDDPVAVEYV